MKKFQEIVLLIIHILSFISEGLLYYINKNSTIKLLCIFDIIQHLLKIFRILIFGYLFDKSSLCICIIHSFINNFTNNGSLVMSCLYIFFYLYIYITTSN